MRYEKPRVKNLCGVTGGKDEDVDRRVEVKETKLGREVRPRIGWPGRKDWKRYRKQNGQVTLGNFTQDTTRTQVGESTTFRDLQQPAVIGDQGKIGRAHV